MFGRRSRRERVRRTRRATLLRLVPMLAVTSLVAALLVVVAVSAPRTQDATPEPADVKRSELSVTPTPDRPSYTAEDAALVAEVDPAVEKIQDGVVVAELEPHELDFELLGVTWTEGLPVDSTEVQVRWQQDGQWSPWTILDAQSQTSEGTTPGTDPKWVGPSQAAQARVVASQDIDPQGLTLVTVAAGEDPVLTPAATVVGQPPIITRAQWGARAYGGSGCGTAPGNGTFTGTIVHHTAGSNNYTAAQSAGIVKSTQAYHMNGQGWCDIGYNFLIDRYGQIFEGRAGGITRTPYGAHAGNTKVNASTTGISLMGEFTSVQAPAAMKNAAVRLTAWRHSLFGIPAQGRYTIGGVSIQRIDGHRSVKATACPGQQVFNWLPTMRNEVAATMASGQPSVGGFADVPANHTFASSIEWLSKSGISTGYVNGGSTTFRGGDAVLREQMAAFLFRFQGKPGYSGPATSPFRDLSTSHTFYREITWLASTKVTTGYVEGGASTYRGTQPVLREQMAAFLYRIATLRGGGEPPVVSLPATSPFVDVPTSHPFYKEIVWLSQQGVSEGYKNANGTYSFRGSQPVLREQMAAFLHRMYGITNFGDVAATHSFRAQIEWMAYSGLAPGSTSGAATNFTGQTDVTRKQMADYLYAVQGRPAFTPPATSPFSDVATTDPSYKAMTWLRATEISLGYPVSGGLPEFRPGQPVLREQVAAFMFRLATIRAGGKAPAVTIPTTSPFADIPTTHSFYRQIVWMSLGGVTTGYVENGETTFRGGAPVLREQMAAFLYRFQRLPR